jgi:hypothetical protein
MPADYRVLGRDTTLRLTQSGVLLAESAVKNLDFGPEFTLLSEGFIGEAAERHREVFKSIDVSFGIEPSTVEIFQLQYAIYNRARSGLLSTVQVNLGYRIQFPTGQIVRITLPDLKFSDAGKLANSGREAFLTQTWTAKTDRYIPSFT